MNKRSKIWRIVVITGWVVLGMGLLTLFVAAMQSRSGKPCKDVVITIKGKEDHPFLNKKDITAILEPSGIDYLRGRPLKDFNLKKMEEKLETNPWVSNAELYFDNNQILQVSVKVNDPLARIFTKKGNSFYIDSNLRQIPLSDRYSPRLPVFTGFPSERVLPKSKDSDLLHQVKNVALFINESPFWMAQIDQVDINQNRKFEMIPKVGDHQIIFGDGNDIEKRFRKLEIFYGQVMSKAGWSDYSVLDVQFDGQLVATKNNQSYHKSDTVLNKRWMKEWQQISRLMLKADSLNRVAATPQVVSNPDSANPRTQPMKKSPSEKNPDPGKSKNSGSKGSVPAERPEPKAVMPPGKKQT